MSLCQLSPPLHDIAGLLNIPVHSASFHYNLDVFHAGTSYQIEALGSKEAASFSAESYADLLQQYALSPVFAGSQKLSESIVGMIDDIDGQPTPDTIIASIDRMADADILLVFFISTEIGLPGGMLSSYDTASAVAECKGEVIIFDLAAIVGMIGNIPRP